MSVDNDVNQRVLPSIRNWYLSKPPAMKLGLFATMGRTVKVVPEIS
jgi:hypothetical protein